MVISEEMKTELFEKYHAKVQGYIYGKVLNDQLAQDLASDVFLKVYEKIDTFDDSKASVSTWIFTVMRNTLIDYYRTRKVFSEVPEEMPLDFSVEEEVLNNEMLETLAKGLEKLEERERDIIIMHYYQGKTLKEAAEAIGISYAYVKILHNKALGELRGCFS